jgi:putative transposase
VYLCPAKEELTRQGQFTTPRNRGNRRQTIFHKDQDYEAFLRVLGEGLEKYPVELFSYVLMPNHWHLVVGPAEDGGMGRLLRWVTATHTQRHHAHYHTAGEGVGTRPASEAFPLKMTSTWLSSVGTSSGIRFALAWSSGPRTGSMARCGNG